MKRIFFAALLALAIPTHAQSIVSVWTLYERYTTVPLGADLTQVQCQARAKALNQAKTYVCVLENTVTPAVPPPTGWAKIADEKTNFTLTAPATVRYGYAAANQWLAPKDLAAGTYACTNAFFGSDPSVGNLKECDKSATAPPPPPPPPPPPASGAQTVTFTQSNEDFLNPGRGMYITPNDAEMGSVSTLTGFVIRWNTRLFQYAPNMSAFMNSNLSAAWLSSLSSKLANARSAGVKIILLPRYQDGGTCTDSPLWKTHLQQLGVVLKANADVLADPIRAGFAGAWGEGWCSSNGLEQGGTNEAAFIAAWDAARPPTHHVAFHTYISSKYPTNPMMGTKNDCILATDTDAHNFDSLSDPRRATIGAMSKQGHPYGGETCDSTSEGNGQQRKSCAQARTELAAMGVSFLNKAYSPVFLDSWTAGGCFDEISRSVGYRYFVSSITFDSTAVAVTVQDIGWAQIMDDRILIVTLRNKATGATIAALAGKLRTVASGATATLTAAVAAPAGAYDILLSAPDPFPSLASDVRYAVRFANADNGAQRWTAPYFATGATLVVQ